MAETYPDPVRTGAWRDAVVGAGFVIAATFEAVVADHGFPGLLAFNIAGALCLAVLAVRRRRPLLTMTVLAAAGVVGSVTTQLLWPEAPDGGGVWIFALMLAAYSLGAYGRGPSVLLGVLGPLVVAASADLETMSGWQRLNGMVFVTVFAGGFPTALGRLVRARRERLRTLRDQHDRIMEAQQVRQDSAVLAERLRAMERLQPGLVQGLRDLAARAESSTAAGEVEAAARALLSRTREEVLALTAPVGTAPAPEPRPVDHVAALRTAAQPWTVLAAGALATGLSVETVRVIAPDTSGWLALAAGLAVGSPLALAWWRPLLAVTLAWIAATAYSRLLAPLDGSLSDVGLVFATSFVVAALSTRRAAVLGLVVCWAGQVLGVGADDPLGETLLLLLCWLGGLAVNEVSRLVEQTRVNNELLAHGAEAYAQHAIVEERLRLAREIHDVVGHSLTVVALQAGAARRLAASEPEQAHEALRTAAAVAREGVTAIVAGEQGVDLAGLIEHTRATGLVLEAELADVHLLAPEQERVAVRVVQEALTNVLRHAPGAQASVTVRSHDDEVEIVVRNSAPDGLGAGPGSGRGLLGIRERVAAAAGRVTWHEREDGGFEVRALLPTGALLAEAR